MTTIYQDSAGILYLGKFLLSNNTSTFKEDLRALFETNPSNSSVLGGNTDRYLRFSFNNKPVSSSAYHIQIDSNRNVGWEIRSSASSSGTLADITGGGLPPDFGPSNGTYAVFGKGVLAWLSEGTLWMFGEAEVSAFPSPLNRFIVDNNRRKGFWVDELDAIFINELYVDEPQASFSINCSGGGTADATWLKLLDKASGKAMAICEGTVMQTEGTNFSKGEVVQVDAPLPDGGSRLFICVGPWGDDGQALMRIAEAEATTI